MSQRVHVSFLRLHPRVQCVYRQHSKGMHDIRFSAGCHRGFPKFTTSVVSKLVNHQLTILAMAVFLEYPRVLLGTNPGKPKISEWEAWAALSSKKKFSKRRQ